MILDLHSQKYISHDLINAYAIQENHNLGCFGGHSCPPELFLQK